MPRSRTSRIWSAMHTRCRNPNQKDWHSYGGRGIRVCDRWRLFKNFLSDMGECPDGLTLDRIDPDKNYERNNCRWATRAMQSRNTRRNRVLEFKGERLCMADWAARFDIAPALVRKRLIVYGWSIERALTERVGLNQGRHSISQVEVP